MAVLETRDRDSNVSCFPRSPTGSLGVAVSVPVRLSVAVLSLTHVLVLGGTALLAACGDSGGAAAMTDIGVDASTALSDAPAAPGDGVAADTDSDTDGDAGGCECPPDQHCDDLGACVVDVCNKGLITCESPTSLRVCDDVGGSFEVVPCGAEEVCDAGACVASLCEPGATICLEGRRSQCNSIGSGWSELPCSQTAVCVDGGCVEVQPNLLLLVDTSGSMNTVVAEGKLPAQCVGDGCPPWDYPNCDDPEDPKTRLGAAKEVIGALIASEQAKTVRLALQRFPQAHNISGGCWYGQYVDLPAMTGDDDSHATALDGWFAAGLSEILAVPFEQGDAPSHEDVRRWIDFKEEVALDGNDCDAETPCDNGFCQFGSCKSHTDPELRAMGLTPLGKSLFYAGEYLQHFVFVDGKPCGEDADCGSPHHHCDEGTCRDPLGACRQTRIILLTDGAESDHADLTDFFHPRVQAKRLHYGLGCDSNADCLAGATCDAGLCEPPTGEVAESGNSCNVYELDCATDDDCLDYACGFGAQCEGHCQPTWVNYDDPGGADHLTDWAGKPVSVTLHVVDASGIDGANKFIAQYGGGAHTSVDLADTATIISQLLPLFDAKLAATAEDVCIP